VYALLLGLGVSRSAKIPTGGSPCSISPVGSRRSRVEDPEPDPAAWSSPQVGHDRLHELSNHRKDATGTSTDPTGVFRTRTSKEREQGLKQPTLAHKAIAKLVADGRGRVILRPF